MVGKRGQHFDLPGFLDEFLRRLGDSSGKHLR